MKAKTLLIAAGLIAGGAILYGIDYVSRMKAVFEAMRIYISRISDVSIGFDKLTFKLSFTIENPTDTGFYLTGAKVATLKSIQVYRKGHYLGMAQIDLEEIELLPKSFLTISDVPFVISTQNLLENILSAADFKPEDLTMVAAVDIAGKEYLIDNSFSA